MVGTTWDRWIDVGYNLGTVWGEVRQGIDGHGARSVFTVRLCVLCRTSALIGASRTRGGELGKQHM